MVFFEQRLTIISLLLSFNLSSNLSFPAPGAHDGSDD